MKEFYCKGKKGFCDKRVCENCEHFNNEGGEYRELPQTEYDRIHAMNQEELGKFLCSLMNSDNCYNNCPARDYCYHGHNGMEEYLSSSVKEEEEE